MKKKFNLFKYNLALYLALTLISVKLIDINRAQTDHALFLEPVYLMDTSNAANGVLFFDHMTRLQPQNPDLWLILSLYLSELKQKRDAERSRQEGLRLQRQSLSQSQDHISSTIDPQK